MVGARLNWEDELGGWLKPFLDRLGHKARRRMCPLYVAGLIGPGDRKSVQPMAERLAPGDYDQLHHFVAAGVWDAAPLEAELLVQADRLVSGSACPSSASRYRRSPRHWARPRTARHWCRPWRSAGDGGFAAIPSRQLDKRSGVVGASWCPGRISNCTDQAGDCAAVGVRFRCVLADAGYGLSAWPPSTGGSRMAWELPASPTCQPNGPASTTCSALLRRNEVAVEPSASIFPANREKCREFR